MKLKVLLGVAALLVVALPAQARAGEFGGVVVAKQLHRGTLVIARSGGAGLTIRGAITGARLGDRVRLEGARLRDGTVRASSLRVLGRTHRVAIRGVVVRRLAGRTLLATGRSVIVIRSASRAVASASDHGDLRTGVRLEFRVRIENGLLEDGPPTVLGQAGDVRIEGAIVTVSPFVVSVEGLPIPIAVPAGMTLPATLVPGGRIELTVHVVAPGSFTLVAIDDVENENATPNPAAAGEVRVKGVVVSSTTTQLVVSSGGAQFTFDAPSGVTLPVLTPGTRVEVRGTSRNGALTLERLKTEDQDEGSGGSGDGGGDGGDGGGH